MKAIKKAIRTFEKRCNEKDTVLESAKRKNMLSLEDQVNEIMSLPDTGQEEKKIPKTIQISANLSLSRTLHYTLKENPMDPYFLASILIRYTKWLLHVAQHQSKCKQKKKSLKERQENLNEQVALSEEQKEYEKYGKEKVYAILLASNPCSIDHIEQYKKEYYLRQRQKQGQLKKKKAAQ